MLYAVFIAVVSYILIRLLALTDESENPFVVFKEGCRFTEEVYKRCPSLKEQYIPTIMFGKNGHLQTLLYGLLGRIHAVVPSERHVTTSLKDGTRITFDLFKSDIPSPKDVTMVVCPGIANTSESIYLRTFAKLAHTHGYRVVVLNHVGVLKSERLTTPRIFSYGDTEEFGAMVKKVKEMFPTSKLIAVGFSMGGNIVSKYLGESPENSQGFLCGISLCQGYNAERALQSMATWSHLSKAYYFVVGQRMKRIIWNNRDALNLNRNDLFQLSRARYLWEVDDAYTKNQHNFKTVEEFYRWCSCCEEIQKIDIPMLLLNSADDPLVGAELCELGQSFARQNTKFMHVRTKHGGHLGFFEGGFIIPNRVTWIDRAVVEYADAVCEITEGNSAIASQ